MVNIVIWLDDEKTQIQVFLDTVKALLPTGEYSFIPTEKNKTLDRKYNIRDKEKVEIIKSLEVSDCVEIRKNDNPRYPDADIFVFIKGVELLFYGEPEMVKLYIKEYILEDKRFETVIVISFHEEGMHDE